MRAPISLADSPTRRFKPHMATIVARNRYELMRLATARRCEKFRQEALIHPIVRVGHRGFSVLPTVPFGRLHPLPSAMSFRYNGRRRSGGAREKEVAEMRRFITLGTIALIAAAMVTQWQRVRELGRQVLSRGREQISVSGEENKAIVRRFLEETMAEGKLDVIDELAAPDFVD